MKQIVFLLILTTLFNNLFAKEPSFYKLPKVNSFVDLRNKNVTMQRFDYSCGSASLATILKYFYNLSVEEADILNFLLQDIQKLKIKKNNIMFSFADLANFVKSKEFKAISLKLDIQTLQKLKIPAIVYVKIRDEEHFTVLKKIADNRVYLADSTFGNLNVSLKQFQEMFEDSDKYGSILLIMPIKPMKINYTLMDDSTEKFNHKQIFKLYLHQTM